MDYKKIFYENETVYKEINYNYLKEFIQKFIKESKLDINEIILIYGVNDYEELFLGLKSYVFKRYPIFIDLFYKLLEESNFLMMHDIFDNMYTLGKNTYHNLYNNEVENLLLSPLINNITYNNGFINLNSKYGEFIFLSIYDYFEKQNIWEYLNEIKLFFSGNCHNESWKLMKVLNNCTLITKLLPFYFEGTFYHSVVKDNNGMFIDLANEIVYDENMSKKLFSERIVCETKKEDLKKNLEIAKKLSIDSNIEQSFNNTLILALHKEALNKK